MGKLSIIDLKDQFNDIYIVNMSWANYSHIMLSLDNTIKQLSKPLEDKDQDAGRQQLLLKYRDLFQKLETNEPRWRSQQLTPED